jgi:putative transposase
MSQSLLDVWIHLVWATKFCAPVLIEGKRQQIFNKISRIAKEKGYHLKIVNGTEDHVHCLVRIKGLQSISRIANDLKGISSHWINENCILAKHFDWQNGYAAFSVCPRNVKKILNYIKNQ